MSERRGVHVSSDITMLVPLAKKIRVKATISP